MPQKGLIGATSEFTSRHQRPLSAESRSRSGLISASLQHNGRWYHFCSKGCKWCFEQEPSRYQGHLSIVDRFLAGEIQPPNLAGALAYMGLAPGEIGDDAHSYAWVEAYRAPERSRA
ncbi:YHS domain-containing protein [Methylibium petroleiphilum]|uniref:YHS domain-containing protein n=1 Tax=Methylibium petroleiphilum TaxID=105560 RepID=UPI0035BF3D3F